jgi:hypothetical protein
MNTSAFKQFIPHAVAIIVFVAISLIYFSPVLDGKTLRQSDIINYKASAKEIMDHKERTGEQALWTNSMFGGMPAFQISVYYKGNVLPAINNLFKFGLPFPANLLFMLMIGFFILMLALRVNPWLGIIGSVAFAFSTYFLIFLAVGHNAKTIAIAYMPAIFAGVILTYRGKYWLGGALTTLFMALEVNANHIQMTYYLLFFLGIYGISELISALIKKQAVHFLKATGITLIAVILSFGPSVAALWSSYDYMKETIRGGAILSTEQENRTAGLDKSYITQWSYGIGETFSLMIPDIKGGESGHIGESAAALDKVDRNLRQEISKQNRYWGNLPFTSGPAYAGAFIVFLFVLGLFIVRGGIKWAILATVILFTLLSWGHNLMGFTEFFLNHIPFYNRFRAVSSALILVEFLMPVLAILALKEIFDKPAIIKEKKWFFIISLACTAGLSLLFIIAPKLFFNFLSTQEANQFAEITQSVRDNTEQAAYVSAYMENLEIARMSIFRSSAWRSIIIILLGAGILFLYYRMKKLNKYIVFAALGLLVIIDLWAINKRYLNEKNFVPARHAETPFTASVADNHILQDSEHFRVLNLATGNFTVDALPSYYHHSIGGYHAAKLRRYQDLIEHRLVKEDSRIKNLLSQNIPDSIRMAAMYGLTSLNMLNTRYYIANPDYPPLRNPAALGNAWFVENVEYAATPDEEINALDNFIPATTAVIHKEFEPLLSGFSGEVDPVSAIRLSSYEPDKMTYEARGLKKPQLAVFSEIYYPRGWNVYINGEEAAYFRANYVLRAMMVPAGDHTIEFRFEPRPYYTGNKISFAGSVIVMLIVLGGLFYEIRKWVIQNKSR